jgi:hypothetical protein
MRWFRRHQCIVGILALFALGFQLAVAFAHVHLDGVRSVFSASASRAASPDRVPAGLPDSPGAPRHDCAVCIAVGLLGNALNGEPPAVSLPPFFHFAPLPPMGASGFSVVRFYSFRTRAPPVA